MAQEKKDDEADDILSQFGPGDDDAALDGAIDDLKGVLQNDADGSLPELGDGDGGLEMPGEADLSQFGGDFDASPGGDFGGDFGDAGADLGGSGLGGSDFGGSDLGGAGSDFGGMDLGGAPASGGTSQAPGSALEANYELIMDIPIDVQIILGTSHMNVATLMNLSEGATIGLDRKIGEPVEIMVNGRLIGRGEITVMEEDETRFGVKLIEVFKTRNKEDNNS